MSRMSELSLEVTNAESVLGELHIILYEYEEVFEKLNISISILTKKLTSIQSSFNTSNLIYNTIFLDIINTDLYENIQKLKSELETYTSQSEIPIKNKPTKELKKIANNLIKIIDILLNNNVLESYKTYNSEKYYSEQITRLNKEKEQLESTLHNLEVSRQNLTLKAVGQEKELQNKSIEIDKAKQELKLASEKLIILEKRLEEKKKQDDAQTEWNDKITSTFSDLSKYLGPINKEYKRLEWLFCAYRILIAIIIIVLFVIECILCWHLSKELEIPQLFKYLPFYAPIPIAGALLWAFITQMNRAQRQLVILAQHIHNTEYIEGLLLSLNKLAPDIENAIKRINNAIDKLLENHLNINSSFSITKEEAIKKEEKKDSFSLDAVIKLLKEIKDISK